MDIYKLLDRFEVLYPDDERFANLRRAYIDRDILSLFRLIDKEELRKAVVEKNINSIFRCVDNKRTVGEIEDLRKAVLEHNLHALFRLLPGNDDLRKAVLDDNLHSIFRLIEDEDLKGLILNDNIFSLWRIIQSYVDTHFVYAFKTMIKEDIPFDEDCFSRGQLESKLWVIQELKKIGIDLGTVFLCAGWYGTLAVMLFESGLTLEKVRSFDVDESTEKIAEIFNKHWVINGWKFKPVVQDIHDINFEEHCYIVAKSGGSDFERLWDTPDTIINTSTEHIDNYNTWYNKIPDDKFIVVQGNDYFEIEEHVNCSKTLKEFSDKSPMTTVLYEGELQLPKYKRFMKIGYK